MPIRVLCPGCSKPLNAPDAAAGKKARCPKCQTIVQLPAAAAATPEPAYEPEPVGNDAPNSMFESPKNPPPEEDSEDSYELAGAPNPSSSQSRNQSSSAAPEPPRRPCPACGEMIPLQALKCRFCDEIFDATLKKAEAKKSKKGFTDSGGSDDTLSTGEWVVAVLCGGIGCIMGIIWMVQGKPKGIKMIGASIAFSAMWRLIGALIGAAAGH